MLLPFYTQCDRVWQIEHYSPLEGRHNSCNGTISTLNSPGAGMNGDSSQAGPSTEKVEDDDGVLFCSNFSKRRKSNNSSGSSSSSQSKSSKRVFYDDYADLKIGHQGYVQFYILKFEINSQFQCVVCQLSKLSVKLLLSRLDGVFCPILFYHFLTDVSDLLKSAWSSNTIFNFNFIFTSSKFVYSPKPWLHTLKDLKCLIVLLLTALLQRGWQFWTKVKLTCFIHNLRNLPLLSSYYFIKFLFESSCDHLFVGE